MELCFHDSSTTVTFRNITTLEALQRIEKLKNRKVSPIYSIPARVLKESLLIFADVLKKCFNNSLDESTFPTNLKAGDVSIIHKKDDDNRKRNYRLITILPQVSKILERLFENQIVPFNLGFSALCSVALENSTTHSMLYCDTKRNAKKVWM